jgi:hypothetical protein
LKLIVFILFHRKKRQTILRLSFLQRSPQDFFDAQYLPENVTLSEVSKMKSESLYACLRKWLGAQESGQQGFCFHNVASGDLRTHGLKRKLSEFLPPVSEKFPTASSGKNKAEPVLI